MCISFLKCSTVIVRVGKWEWLQRTCRWQAMFLERSVLRRSVYEVEDLDVYFLKITHAQIPPKETETQRG